MICFCIFYLLYYVDQSSTLKIYLLYYVDLSSTLKIENNKLKWRYYNNYLTKQTEEYIFPTDDLVVDNFCLILFLASAAKMEPMALDTRVWYTVLQDGFRTRHIIYLVGLACLFLYPCQSDFGSMWFDLF